MISLCQLLGRYSTNSSSVLLRLCVINMYKSRPFFTMLFRDEGRLAWMYKDKVDNEEYLLGRRIDSSTLNDSEPATNG